MDKYDRLEHEIYMIEANVAAHDHAIQETLFIIARAVLEIGRDGRRAIDPIDETQWRQAMGDESERSQLYDRLKALIQDEHNPYVVGEQVSQIIDSEDISSAVILGMLCVAVQVNERRLIGQRMLETGEELHKTAHTLEVLTKRGVD